MGVGEGKNQKLADSEAARVALAALKSEAEEKNAPTPDSQIKLRELCAKAKQPTPEWRDLGETAESSVEAPIFKVECRAMGKSAQGTGRSKQEARSAAAKIIIDALNKRSEPQSKATAPKKPKTAAKKRIGEAIASQKESAKPIEKESHHPKKKPAWQKKHL
jgi:dsRNA-specific ribonuclease